MSDVPKVDLFVIGGGINGLCIAWQLAQAGHQVTVYEQNTVMSGTSSPGARGGVLIYCAGRVW